MRARALPRLLVLVLAVLLVAAVMAMHALGMPMSPTAMHGAMAQTAHHVGVDVSTISAEPSACTSTHCVAARGGEPVAAQALPAAAFVILTQADLVAAPVVAEVTIPSRAPPRSGSCSPLCVWRQ